MSETDNMNLTTLLQEKHELQRKLAELGLLADHLESISYLVNDYNQLEHNLYAARKQQFYNDAYTLCSQVKMVDKAAKVTPFLRQFAEHIVSHVLLANQQKSAIEIVDEIPPMDIRDPYNRD